MVHSPCKIFSGWWSVQQLDCWDWNSAPRGGSFPLLPFLWRRAVIVETLQPDRGECVWLPTQIWLTHEQILRGHTHTNTHTGMCPHHTNGCVLLISEPKQTTICTTVCLPSLSVALHSVTHWQMGWTGLPTAAFPGHVAARTTWNITSHLSTPTATRSLEKLQQSCRI